LLLGLPEVATSDNESLEGQPVAAIVQDLRDFSTSKHNHVGKEQKKVTRPSPLTEQQRPLSPKPDGANANATFQATFHGIPLKYVRENRPSVVHCVGENFLPSAWFYRSCQFRHLCFDTTTATEAVSQEGFVVFQSASQERATAPFNTEALSPYARSSTNFQQAVSSTGKVGKEQSKWFPRTVPFHEDEHTNGRTDVNVVHQGYYALPDNIVWAPFATQPGLTDATSHLLMDYAFPIFNLLSMFGLEDRSLLLTTLNTDQDQDCASANCSETFRSILPLMKLARGHSPLYSTGRIMLHKTGTDTGMDEQHQQQGTGLLSGLVCARYGVAGIGALTDHGSKQHGELATDYHYAQNTGRGPLFFAFRAYILNNLGLATSLPNDATSTAKAKATATTTRQSPSVPPKNRACSIFASSKRRSHNLRTIFRCKSK
jgi:hypothetical protein